MARRPIYLDYQATTPVDPRVLEAMLPYFTERFGNPASHSHAFGWAAAEAVEAARAEVAGLIGADPREIVFTSGATESNNLALKGIAEAYAEAGDHLITAATEHRAVLDTMRHLEARGRRATYLPVDRTGLVDLDALQGAITDRTVLVSIMFANNEIGTVAPVADLGRLCRERGVLFHTDAAQAAGKIPVDVESMFIDLLSLTAHKFYGPKGVGALYVRRRRPRVRLVAQMDGGGHERGLRSGTLNAPGIVGFGAAAALCRAEMAAEAARTARLRDRLRDGIIGALAGVTVNGHPTRRLPNNLNLAFEGVDGDALLAGLPDVALSSGSACTSASPEPSHVLRALGLTAAEAQSSIRFGLGRFTTEEEVDEVVGRVTRVVEEQRRLTRSALTPASSLRGPATCG